MKWFQWDGRTTLVKAPMFEMWADEKIAKTAKKELPEVKPATAFTDHQPKGDSSSPCGSFLHFKPVGYCNLTQTRDTFM